MSIQDKEFLPWVTLSTDRLEKELQAQQQFVPACKTHYPLSVNVRKETKTKAKKIEIGKKFIPGKIFFPLLINSSLTKQQQAVCLKVLQLYQSERNLDQLTNVERANLEIYKSLHSAIQEEHVKFSNYVKKEWETKWHRSETMKSVSFNYVKALWEDKLQKVCNYPSCYQMHTTVCIAYEDPENNIQVSLQENVLNIGPTKTALFPTLTSQYKLKFARLPRIGDYLLKAQTPVSRDVNIEQILSTHNIDVVLSMSATKKLMDDTNPNSVWHIPVAVKEHKVQSPDGNVKSKKVVYVDKILPAKNPAKFEFNKKCHKMLIRNNMFRVFENSNNAAVDEASQNVVYSVWCIDFNDRENVLMKTRRQNKKINFLLRQKIDGYECLLDGGKRPVVFVPKIEYQLEHGATLPTKTELIRQWTDLFFRPYSHLYRIRVQANNSEVVDVESVSLQKINTEAMQHHQYKPHERLGALFTVFTKLIELECGNYMLHHNERTEAFVDLLQDCPETYNDIKLDLAKAYNDKDCCVQASKMRPWCPIDVNYILPVHSAFKRMPGMFKPLIVMHGKNKNAKKNMKKKKNKQQKRKGVDVKM